VIVSSLRRRMASMVNTDRGGVEFIAAAWRAEKDQRGP
jgi:hypothetical protein